MNAVKAASRMRARTSASSASSPRSSDGGMAVISVSLDIGTAWYHTRLMVLIGTNAEATMLKPRILVTGATGKTGSVVVAELLKAGYPVRALVHQEDGRSAR